MADETLQSMSLNVLVEKVKNRVVFAEPNRDFVDVLFSFVTMPIGTIIRLTREQLLEGEMGCLNNLYASVENLDEEHVQSMKCKDMLLRPLSAAEIYCRNLKLNLVDGNTNEYYACSAGVCGFVSPYQTAHCRCGRPLDREVKLLNPISIPQDGGVFVKPNARFMISDDFQVMPMSTVTALTLLSKLGAVNRSTMEKRTINIGRNEVLKLLKCSLTSRTPFSDTIMEPPISKTNFTICRGKYGPRSTNQSERVMVTAKKDANIKLKLIVNKSENRALYAEVEEDFVNLISSFLTLPLGYLFKEFPCLPFKGCMNNLYQSIQNFDAHKFLKSEEMKAILVNPKLTPGLAYNNQLIPIEEALYPSCLTLNSLFSVKCSGLSLMPNHGEAKTGDGFMKGPSVFMVTNNLLVTPLSIISGISLINSLGIPFSAIGEQEVTMGEDEAMRLLAAALVSDSALTDTFILKEPKEEA
ncbi:hypothetical protein F0562_029058 [Nyssa sinensis]|uniref:DUF674 domain-containing protein n=1 Tax=Nyssa sinensis TaxID=561372 RepID=A0A5J5B205_9ASTE|nr:hypothetical protein F0562_029058 [Nyssa sinensis]